MVLLVYLFMKNRGINIMIDLAYPYHQNMQRTWRERKKHNNILTGFCTTLNFKPES